MLTYMVKMTYALWLLRVHIVREKKTGLQVFSIWNRSNSGETKRSLTNELLTIAEALTKFGMA